MNYLAHIYLSFDDDQIMIGNFIADFLKNKEVEALPLSIRNGVELHRKIDSFTDTHPIFRSSTKLFHERHGKYASVLTDIYYDLLLINNWTLYSQESLKNFTERQYPILLKYKKHLPKKLKIRIDKMIEDKFLLRYSTPKGLMWSLEWMDKRTKFPSRFVESIKDFQKNEVILNQHFNEYFPLLIEYAKKAYADYPSK